MSRVPDLFQENFTSHGELGASVSVWQDGKEILSLAGGWRDREQTQPWTTSTPVLVWSATKGPAAACVLHACQAKGVALSTPVAEFWPEFAAQGKERITLAEVMSHQAGLPVLDIKAPALDHAAVASALAAQAPHWTPGDGHGYHVRTYGYLSDEIVRRLAGIPLRDYWQREFAQPMGLDFWIGLPAERLDDVAPVFAARGNLPKDDFYTAFVTPGSFTVRAFGSPHGLGSVSAMNTPEVRMASLPASGGIGTARSLGKFYAMLANGGALDGRTYFQPEMLAAMETTLTEGTDRVLLMETAFAFGFMRVPIGPDGHALRSIFGPSSRAFGHPGAGGSLAFADPARRLSFAYVMNQMEPGVMPGGKALRMVEALYAGGLRE